jgi:hypothetical protein
MMSELSRFDQPATRFEMFQLISKLFQACTYQQMMMQSLRTPELDDFEKEYEMAQSALDGALEMLNGIGKAMSGDN